MASQRMIQRRALETLAALLLAVGAPGPAAAQVGLSSGIAQVVLLARVAPRGSISGVGPEREIARTATVREASVSVKVSANTGYQLIVRGTTHTASRVWVRAVGGEYQELKAGSAVTVAKDSHRAGEWEIPVQYRIQIPEGAAANAAPLPVRYEIAISPTL